MRKSAFVDNLTRGLSTFSRIEDIDLQKIVDEVSNEHLVRYLDAISTEDQTNIVNAWRTVSESVAIQLVDQASKKGFEFPAGFKEFAQYQFFIGYAADEANQDVRKTLKEHPELTENIGRYYVAFGHSPSGLQELRTAYENCSKNQMEDAISTLRGEELERISKLFTSSKWSAKLVEVLRQNVSTRQLSYTSLANSLTEINAAARIYLILKNEGMEETEEERPDEKRIVTSKMKELREAGKLEIISYMSSVHFARDPKVVEDFLKSLPKGVENNYVVFAAELEPLTMRIETPDHLKGKPASLYANLQRFSDIGKI